MAIAQIKTQEGMQVSCCLAALYVYTRCEMPGKYLGGPYSQLSHPHQLTARRMRPPQHRNTMPPSGHHHHVAGTAALTWWYELYAAHVAMAVLPCFPAVLPYPPAHSAT